MSASTEQCLVVSCKEHDCFKDHKCSACKAWMPFTEYYEPPIKHSRCRRCINFIRNSPPAPIPHPDIPGVVMIPLNGTLDYALASAEDAEMLGKYRWNKTPRGVSTTITNKRRVQMNNLILEGPQFFNSRDLKLYTRSVGFYNNNRLDHVRSNLFFKSKQLVIEPSAQALQYKGFIFDLPTITDD